MSRGPTFARHESFYPRVGWLWKAVNVARETPDVFLRDDATVSLGVGKNMVRAIRYWGLATRVLSEYPDPDFPRRTLVAPTRFGQLVFGPDGWDPYAEDPRTLWVLHWLICRAPSAATAWALLFGLWSRGDFTEQDALAWLRDRISREPSWPEVPDASLRRDVQCITQMYAPSRRRGRADDAIESPFRDIGLLALTAGDMGRWRFVYGPKLGLTDGVIAFACLDFLARDSHSTTHTISRLALEPFSPGMVFRLSEEQIARALSSVASASPPLEVVAPAGVRQLATRTSASEVALGILATEYGRSTPTGSLDSLVNGLSRQEAVA